MDRPVWQFSILSCIFWQFDSNPLLHPKGGPDAFRDKTNRQLEVSFLRPEENGGRRGQEYLEALTACEELKTLHMSRCLAQYCVNNKLKSPLGKAQVSMDI